MSQAPSFDAHLDKLDAGERNDTSLVLGAVRGYLEEVRSHLRDLQLSPRAARPHAPRAQQARRHAAPGGELEIAQGHPAKLGNRSYPPPPWSSSAAA